MKAIVQDRFGLPDALEMRDIDTPPVADGEVLVRVAAAAINPADWAFMRGVPYLFRPMYGLTKPRDPVRGSDVAGTVVAVGNGVTRFQQGDEVFGSGRGTLAEYAVAKETNLAIKPANLTSEEAAAIPMAGLTALQALRAAKVEQGQKVLVTGASGGVGSFTVQVAKAMGAEVTAVCSTRNVDRVRSIGADYVIDYTQEDFTENGCTYDVVVDNAGTRSLRDTGRAMSPKGTLIPNNGQLDRLWVASLPRLFRTLAWSLFVGQKARMVFSTANREDLESLKEMIEAGQVKPLVDRTYQLTEAPEAMAYLGEGHARGKIVVVV
jgi:NADPH:quinone reductase-like Zn-dependent oxidoreductase